MTRREKIIYWGSTLWLALGMVSTGIVQLIQMEDEVANFAGLGYPTYLMTILGVSKILGTIAVLVPGYPIVKEWAYAGFFFTMTGAILSHLITGDVMSVLPPLLLLVLTIVSWYSRPVDRKAVTVS